MEQNLLFRPSFSQPLESWSDFKPSVKGSERQGFPCKEEKAEDCKKRDKGYQVCGPRHRWKKEDFRQIACESKLFAKTFILEFSGAQKV